MPLIKGAREIIIKKFGNTSLMTKENLIEEIRPHYIFDKESLIKQDLNRIANRLASSVRDQNGRRNIFPVKEGDKYKYVNIDETEDLEEVRKIYEGLVRRKQGLNPSLKKVYKRRREIEGQQSLEFGKS